MQRSEALDLLKRVGLRITAPRVAVIQELHAHPHADADTIRRGVRERLGSVSTQAVYDVLNTLRAHSVVRRVEPAGSPALYELDTGDNHHHIICRSCGEVSDVACATGVAPCMDPTQTHGFVIDEAEVIFWGHCPACQSAAQTTSTPADRDVTAGVEQERTDHD